MLLSHFVGSNIFYSGIENTEKGLGAAESATSTSQVLFILSLFPYHPAIKV